MVCQVCKTSGSNMQKCKKCGKVWCKNCAFQGKAPYPKQKALNRCPYCNSLGTVEPAK